MSDVLSLPVEERLRLIEEIWETITEVPDALELTEGQRKELDARLDAYRREPHKIIPWEDVKASMSSK